MNILSEISVCKEILDEDPNLFMASFDIQSLFTNIPLDEIIDISVDTVFDKRKKVKGMLKRHSFCETVFFNDVFYKQIDGVAMGECQLLESCPIQFRPKYYRRYVDHILPIQSLFQNYMQVFTVTNKLLSILLYNKTISQLGLFLIT